MSRVERGRPSWLSRSTDFLTTPIHFKVRTTTILFSVHQNDHILFVQEAPRCHALRGHPDHLATLSLLHCTETVIRVMREVKLPGKTSTSW